MTTETIFDTGTTKETKKCYFLLSAKDSNSA
jgi:hypothetical protein